MVSLYYTEYFRKFISVSEKIRTASLKLDIAFDKLSVNVDNK